MRVGCVYINAGKGQLYPANCDRRCVAGRRASRHRCGFLRDIDAPRWIVNQRIWRCNCDFRNRAIRERTGRHSKTIRKLFAAMQNVLYRRRFADWISLNRPMRSSVRITCHRSRSRCSSVRSGSTLPVFATQAMCHRRLRGIARRSPNSTSVPGGRRARHGHGIPEGQTSSPPFP